MNDEILTASYFDGIMQRMHMETTLHVICVRDVTVRQVKQQQSMPTN